MHLAVESKTSKEWYYSNLKLEPDKYIDNGDLIYSWSASFGPFIWEGGKAIYHYHIWKMDFYDGRSLNKHFIKLYLQAISASIKASGNGIAMIHMTKDRMEKLPLPIPPLAEQHRIVAKVDELMALCDQLELQTESSITAHQTLVETLLGALTQSTSTSPSSSAQLDSHQATSQDTFEQAWQRIAEHFDTLFTTEQSVELLKQSILQLAVMGKLVPQDPDDEPASELLKRIAVEKDELVEAKKLKKQKALPEIGKKEMPFELPTSWDWCSVGHVGDIKLGRQRSPKDHVGPHMVPYLRVANVHDNRIDTSDIKEMNFSPEEQKIFKLEHGDILLNEGQSRELVGRPAIYRNEVKGSCFQNTLIRLRAFGGIDPEYALIYFRNCLYSGRFQKAVKQTTNMAHLSATRLIPIEFPLPPYNEQKRIVIKVDQLLDLCMQLKIGLADSQATQFRLADAVTKPTVN